MDQLLIRLSMVPQKISRNSSLVLWNDWIIREAELLMPESRLTKVTLWHD